MQRLTFNPTLALLAAGFGLFALVAYVQYEPDSVSAQDWQPIADVAPPPSADNVDPAFHARLMRLREHLVTAPDDTTALLELARLEQDAHQHDVSAEHYERFLAISPHNHQVWLDLANVYAGQELWDAARNASERMLEYYPDDPSAMYNLGAIHANAGDVDTAQAWWTKVRDSGDANLAEQAAGSLGQLANMRSRPAASRPAASRPAASRPAASRPAAASASTRARPANPHTATPTQPVVAHRLSSLSSAQ